MWKNAVVEATADHVWSAMEWVGHLPLLPNSEVPRSTILEGVTVALKDEQVQNQLNVSVGLIMWPHPPTG